MAFAPDVLTYKDASDASKNTLSVSEGGTHVPAVANYTADGVAVSASAPLPVAIISDAAGSAVVTDDGSVPRNNAAAALAAAVLYGANGTGLETVDRIIAHIFTGALKVSEGAAAGTATAVQVTVAAADTNGTVVIAANSAGTRRRVVVTNHTTKDVYLKPANLTAGATTDGELLVGVKGAQSVWFIAGQLRGTVATGDTSAVVGVREEVLA